VLPNLTERVFPNPNNGMGGCGAQKSLLDSSLQNDSRVLLVPPVWLI
jgi:hypothetical protein